MAVAAGERNAAATSVQQRLVFVGKDAGKGFALRDLLRGGGLKAPILVFVSSSERAKQLHRCCLHPQLACSCCTDRSPVLTGDKAACPSTHVH